MIKHSPKIFPSKENATIPQTLLLHKLIIIIITHIYNALNNARSAYRIHNKLRTLLSKYIHVQNKQF